MKKLFRNIVLTFGLLNLVSVPAYPALTVPDTARLVYQNLLDNPGFENGNTKWTASGGATKTANTTAKGTGNYGYDWDSNGAAQTLTSTAVTIPAGMQGQNAYLTCGIKTPSGTATHTINAFDGTNILASTTITTSSTRFAAQSLNFVMPTSGTIAIRISSVASNEPEIYIDDCYLGLAYNISTSTNVTNPVAYTPTLTGFGVASSINVQSWRDGAYLFVEGTFTSGTATATEARINLGYNGVDGNVTTLSTLPTVSIAGQLTTSDTAATAPWNILVEASKTYVTIGRQWNTYSGLAKQNGSAVAASSVVVSFAFRVPIQGWSAEPAFRPDLAAVSWSGYHDSTCSWSRTNAAYGDFTADVSCALVERTNRNFGTVSASGSVLPAITFTPARTGRYYVCAIIQAYSGTAGNSGAVRLWDGTTVIAEAAVNYTNSQAQPVCGIYDITSTSAKTITLQGKSASSTINIQTGSANSMIEWSIFALDQGFPAPVLVGSVTSNSSGAERIERVKVGTSACSSSPCTIAQQSGSWISSVTRNSAGNYTLNIASGMFSSTPTCTCVSNVYGTSHSYCSGPNNTTTPSATSWSFETKNSTNASTNADSSFEIICMGPK